MGQKLYGGVELGGTKTICAIGDASGNITSHTTVPTTSVEETFAAVFEFFEQSSSIASLGIASFGPVQVHPSSSEFGFICNTPKPGWSKVNVKGAFEEALKLDVTIDTDVNCAALGEQYFGVAKHSRNFIYLTLGTGIGGGLMRDGKIIHGILNLEMGHMRIPHEPFTDLFQGACVYHGDCVEGIASGHAMAQRYDKKAQEITETEIWEIEAGYIASALNNLMTTIGPELIVIGGGLIDHPGLMASIRVAVQNKINNYLKFPDLENYIVKSSGEMNGVRGAIKLTAIANDNSKSHVQV